MTYMDQFRNSSYFYAIIDRLASEFGDYTLEPKGKTSLKVMAIDPGTGASINVGLISGVTKNPLGANVFKLTDLVHNTEWTPEIDNSSASTSQYA